MISYHDLCKEIEIIELRCGQLERETTQIYKLMNKGPQTRLVSSYDTPPGGSNETPLDKLYTSMIKIEKELNILRDILTDKKRVKSEIEKKMTEFEGLEYKVAYKRDIEGKPLDVIADELGFSYGWIRKVSMRTRKMRSG